MRTSLKFLIPLALVSMALTACGNDSGGGSATDTGATDSTADATTDAGSDAAVDAAGDATTTAASYGKGCTSDDDKAFRKMLGETPDKGKEFTGVVKDCTLTKGCLTKSGDKAQQDCIRDCILEAQISKDGKLSSDCGACYGTYKGHCGAKKCITFCAVDAASAGCQDCLKTNCDPGFDACVEGDK